MFAKIKITLIGFALFFISFFAVPSQANAALYQFDAINHPAWGNYAGQGPAGLFIYTGGWKVFGFVDVKLVFNTDANSAVMSGSILHHVSGETWNMTYTLSNPNVTGSALEDIVISFLDPTTNPGKKVYFGTQHLTILPTVANPTYQGYTDTPGKMNAYIQHDHVWNDFTGGSGWLLNGGDIHYGIINGRRIPPVIPEPSTFVLLGLGVLAAGAFQRRKKA